MTLLADAAALVAIETREDEAGHFLDAIDRHDDRLYCATGAWEAAVAVARKRGLPLADAARSVRTLLFRLGFRSVPIGDEEGQLAIVAHDRFGKGSGHPARLNMGDCFAYACAKANDAALLFKGNDFIHTDVVDASRP